MSLVTLQSRDSGSTARICVERGFNCFDFQADVEGRMITVLDSQPGFETGAGRESGNGIPLLFPYPNRIRAGRYSWAGRDWQLPEGRVAYDRTGNAIHGFCLDRPWRVIDRGPDCVTGEFRLSVDAPDRREFWPADFVLRVRYHLAGATLHSEFQVINPDTVTLPWGLGTHAYFRLPLSDGSRAEQCLLVAPVTRQWDLIDCLPTGAQQPLSDDLPLWDGVYFGQRPLDNVFGGVPADLVECSIIDEHAGLQVTQRNPGSFSELVIYTPPGRDAVCFEPYTCVTDAVNLEPRGVNSGWRTLGPGERFSTWIDIQAGLVLA